MGFNDDIIQLTGGKGFKGIGMEKDKAKKPEVPKTEDKPSSSEAKEKTTIVKPSLPDSSWYGEIGSSSSSSGSAQDYVIESDLVSPVIKAVKAETEKPLIVFVDDDFETLDLCEIYLKRGYTYEAFSGPREAIFFLNQHVPELVFIDCKIHTMKALTFMEIVRTGAGNENVQFVLVGSEFELSEVNMDFMPDYVIGTLKRPVARGELQKYIDMVIKKDEAAN